ncbi:MAG: PQQ-like beta-propeller repeat protein, partial [Armatimonadetes bacterium]|nr:PQQ-like beta-propeller repeat protein [Armatimonadota bacterium]
KQISQTGAQRRKLQKQLQDDPDNADLKAQLQQVIERLKDLQVRMQPYTNIWYVRPPAHPVNGYTSATPVSDGEHVWAIFGNGIACCYDLDGNRIWARPIEKPRRGYGHSASPILAGGYLIVHVLSMRALDPMTGEQVWEAALPVYWGTPVATEIEDTPVIISPRGDVVNATDGAVLARGIGNCNYCAPIVEDGVVYFADDRTPWRAVKLPDTLDPFQPEELWRARPKKDRYYASPVIYQGIIYGVTRNQVFSALDAATGEILYEQNMLMGKGQCYPSVTLAGDKLLVGCDNGVTVVVEPGRTYREIARNTLEPFRSSPVFAGDRMFVRGLDNMYCIGANQ